MPLDVIGLKARAFRYTFLLTGVADYTLRGKGRSRTVVEARQALMFALWDGGMSYSAIGRLLGKHHTTIMHGVKQAVILRENHSAFRDLCGVLRRLIFNEGGTDSGEGCDRTVDTRDGREAQTNLASDEAA
jgi:hypothetical protein